MHPAKWWGRRIEAAALPYMVHVSAPFYLRTAEPTQKVKFPPILIGKSNDLKWDRNGTDNFGGSRIHGDVSLVSDRLRVAILDTDAGVQRREFATSTVATVKNWAATGLASGSGSYSIHCAFASTVANSSTSERVYFNRVKDMAQVGFFAFDSMADPTGYRIWAAHNNAITLTYAAANGPLAYYRAIASATHTYAAGCGGSTVEDRAKIIGYKGPDPAATSTGNEVPQWISIQGEAVVGTTVVNKPVGRLGENILVFQQAAIESTPNPNPSTQPYIVNGYAQTGVDKDGKPTYGSIPNNQYLSNNSSYAQLWSARCWRVDIVHLVGADGSVQVTATRTLIGQALNEWVVKKWTGKGPGDQDPQAYVYDLHHDYVYDPITQTGSYKDTYTVRIDPNTGKPVEIDKQWIPAVRGTQWNADGTPKTDPAPTGNGGYVLCAIMATRKDGVIEKRAPWNTTAALQEVDGNGNLSYIPAGLVEVNPSLWLAVSRYTVGDGGSPRWMYSRDKAKTWTLISTDYTQGSPYRAGVTAVTKELTFPTTAIRDGVIALEKPV